MAELLTGQNWSKGYSFRWTRSEEVDVAVIDLYNSSPGQKAYHIQNIEALSEFLQKPIPVKVTKRLFLIEDMTAPVVKLLGAALGCQPDLFAAHMQHYGEIWRTPIDSAGNSMGGSCIACTHRGPPRPLSSYRRQPYFSFPFRRRLRHSNEGQLNQVAGNRTMFRDYNDYENAVEERISGALYSGRGTTATTG